MEYGKLVNNFDLIRNIVKEFEKHKLNIMLF